MAEQNLTGEVFYPNEKVINHANAKCDELYSFAANDYQGFWSKESEKLHWFKKWKSVLDDSKKPFFKWFIDGKTNICRKIINHTFLV